MSKMIASLSMDLDNKWAYLRAAGNQQWQQSSSYLPTVIPRVVEMLGELALPLTVFLVGRDLDCDRDRAAIAGFESLSQWEPANHSMNHLPWMHTMQPDEIAEEIESTGTRVAEATGRTPFGFRGPGFSCPEEVLRVLVRNDYQYDASIFPTSIAPLARAVFLMKTELRGEDRQKAKQLYGGFSSLRNPNRPFLRNVDGNELWEVPVTVMPLLRTPIHFSYFTYLASFSTMAAKAYFKMAIGLCRLTGTPPSLLLHPPDFLGRQDDREMAYFPGMKMDRAEKLAIVRWALERYASAFDVHCMIDQVKSLTASETASPAYSA